MTTNPAFMMIQVMTGGAREVEAMPTPVHTPGYITIFSFHLLNRVGKSLKNGTDEFNNNTVFNINKIIIPAGFGSCIGYFFVGCSDCHFVWG